MNVVYTVFMKIKTAFTIITRAVSQAQKRYPRSALPIIAIEKFERGLSSSGRILQMCLISIS